MKKVLVADTLPQGMQDELGALLKALEAKYGAHAVTVGVNMENLATLVAMIGSGDVTASDRAHAAKSAAHICNDVICTLGEAMNVKPEAAFAVAQALADHSHHINEELCGEATMPGTVTAEADAVIAKARVLH